MKSDLAPEEYIRIKVKAELRKRLRGVRKTAPLEACQQRSAKIVAALLALPEVANAKSVALFWPIEARHEVDLRALDASLRARGAKVAYPAIDQDTNEMTFRFVPDVTKMEELGLGFSEPPADAPLVGPNELDVIVVPAIAADPSGHRIGYGAGYYDRTLPNFTARTIAVVYDYQLIAEVPFTPTDVRVAKIVTDTRVLDAQ